MHRLKDKRTDYRGHHRNRPGNRPSVPQRGRRLAITGRNPATLAAARKELGADVLVISSDAGDVEAQKTVAETFRQAFGGLDVLFLNAGIADLRPVERWDELAFDASFATNVKGPYF
jgi:NAD(P)-dependent dehydrogenase (short-subunit alcohol dehydrogenase family)